MAVKNTAQVIIGVRSLPLEDMNQRNISSRLHHI